MTTMTSARRLASALRTGIRYPYDIACPECGAKRAARCFVTTSMAPGVGTFTTVVDTHRARLTTA